MGRDRERERRKKTFGNAKQPVCNGICIWQQNLGLIPVQEIPTNVPEASLDFKARGATVLGVQTLAFRNRKLSKCPPDGLSFQSHITEFGFKSCKPCES